MRIRVGCELTFEFPQPTPMIACLNVHFSRFSDLERPDYLVTNPPVPVEGYRDSFGNWELSPIFGDGLGVRRRRIWLEAPSTWRRSQVRR